ncbi:MAG: F0F1 ATP synthase subunit A [Alphaproteobacteria bacterium]|nr:F0F1 ATP synthase subunit A [Alphaproteobacteria bacterium]
MADPLHQFVIQPIIDLPDIGGLNLDFTNSSLWMGIAVVVSITMMSMAMRRKALIPGRLQVFAEVFYQFVSKMVQENLGPEGRRYFPFVFTVFVVVLMGNLLGMVPGSFTYTSHLVVTGALALLVFGVVVMFGFMRHGFHFFSLFFPSGVPFWIMPLITPIEIISFLSRPVTLALRLFVNMFAGHLMLKVIAGFSVSLATLGAAGLLGSLGPMFFNVLMIGFEVFVAVVQAYVFAMLTCIYLKDTIEIGH